ncbi:TIR domain-containing protein [Paenibacillus sp. GbtcB18]|uniref:TIR domain-containing protein n=1 Tax=Paenibacillus sp. GbtcB18 TaxID=2824763 RepID=UPI001C302100|nr:nucleotide-binding protein [Paenibacillus sp. GbtcB18]
MDQQRKPKVFIGSSREAIPIAEGVLENLSPAAQVNPWFAGAFNPGRYTMEDLDKQVQNNDFALFILSTDDVVQIRGKQYASARDNTIFEMGLFMSRLGRERVFFLLPDHIPESVNETAVGGLRTPSDLFGVNALTFEIRSEADEWVQATAAACSTVKRKMRELGCLSELPTINQLARILRLFRTLLKGVPFKPEEENSLQTLSEGIRISYTCPPQFTVKGVTIHSAEQDEWIKQVAGTSNIGTMNRTYPLTANENLGPEDKRILVVDAHLNNRVTMNLHSSSIENEYLICYPLAKKYVLTVHMIGQDTLSSEQLNKIAGLNGQLISSVNDLLGGE